MASAGAPRHFRSHRARRRLGGEPGGVRSDARRDHLGQAPAPNLQPPGLQLVNPRTMIAHVCFGPIAPTWPARAERLGAHAATFDPRTYALRPLPEGVEGAYFNVVPADQQLEATRPATRIGLEHLPATHALLATKLAARTPRARVECFASRAPEELRLRCDTLAIDTDRALHRDLARPAHDRAPERGGARDDCTRRIQADRGRGRPHAGRRVLR